MRAQPLLVVADVNVASRFYRTLLGCVSGHGDVGERAEGADYERLVDPRLHHTRWGTDGLILQLHRWDVAHHHGELGDPAVAVGNGVVVWFEVDDFDDVVVRARALGAVVVKDVCVNENAGHRELWLKDPDGYTVVVSSSDGHTG